jgi:voltage-gated potassium channel
MFAVDYLARLILADNRRRYASRHLLDLVIIALPLLRPLRLLRLVSLLNVLHRRASTALRGRIAVYVAGGSLLIAFCGALAVLDAERANPEANIKTFGDAIWWAFTTMTTVGYGDRYPTTTVGRLAAVGLMISGVALLGVVTATFASWLIEQVAQTEDQQTSELRAEIAVLSN